MDQLGAISLFNKVVETGSFSEAGRQSGMAPSSVSRRIVDLEDWLGAALFHRTTRKLNLTEAGQSFYEHSKQVLLDLEQAKVLASKRQDKPAGVLRISLPASLEQHIVVATADFQDQWPDVSFNLTSTDRNVDLIAEGFDIAIRAGKLSDSSLRARKIAEVKRHLCASEDYIKKAPRLQHPSDIKHHQCLLLRRLHGENIWQFSDSKKLIEVRASGNFEANSGNILITAARQGRGLILATDWILGPHIAQGELIKLLPDYAPYPATSTLYALHPYQRYIPPKVRLFIDFLIERFADNYDWSKNPGPISHGEKHRK